MTAGGTDGGAGGGTAGRAAGGEVLARSGSVLGRAGRAARPSLVAAGAVAVLLVVAGVWPELIARQEPDATDLVAALQPPSWSHWFGTDQLGRDVFARVVHGARYSLLLGLGATAVGVVGGTVVGLAAALGGRLADGLLMRLADVLLAFPEMLLALLVIAVVGPGQQGAAIAIGVAAVPGYARVVRAGAMVVRHAGYVEAAVVLGLRPWAVVARHVLPNALGPLLVLATVGVGTAVIAGSALSFLGLGARPPTPEWGAMLSDGRDYVESAWWIAVFPGAAITATVVSVTVLGRAARRRAEGRTS